MTAEGFRFLVESSVAVVVVVVVFCVVVIAVEVVIDIALVTVDNLLDTRVIQHTPIEMNSFIKDFVEKVLLVKSTKTSRAHLKVGRYFKSKSIGKIV